MGITLDKYFENIHSVIFSPKAFFAREDMSVSVRLAVVNVVGIAFITKITGLIFDSSLSSPFFIATLIWSIISSIFIWFITALFFEYVAKIFGKDGNLSKILFLTSFAPIPYIFFAPLNLIKSVGNLGYLLGAYFEFFLYLWIIFLYLLALSATYKITLARSFMLILLPFIAFFFAIYWLICFCSRVWYIFSI